MKLISKLKYSSLAKKIVYVSVIGFFFLYVLSVPAFGESSSITRYIIYVSMFLLGASSFLYCFLYFNFKIKKPHLLVPLFALFALFGTILNSHEHRAWFSLVLLMISFFIFYYSFRIIKNKELILLLISLAFFLFSLFFIFYYRREIIDFKSYTNSNFRLGSYFDNPNAIGVYAIIGISTSLYLFLFSKIKLRFLLVIPIGTSLLVGLTTGSKSFFISFLFMVLVFFFFKFKNHKLIYLLIVAGLIGVSVLVLSLPFMSTIRDRLLKAFGTISGTGARVDTSTVERVLWMDYGFFLGAKKIIFGYGVGGFAIYSGVGTYTHSNFSEILCDFGVIGLLLFYAPMVILFIKAITNRKIDKAFVITFFLYYLLANFSSVYYYKKIYYLILAFLYYLVYVDGECLKTIKLVPEIKTIVFTCDTMGAGGAENVIATLSNEFSNRGIKICIIGVGDQNEPKPFYQLNNNVDYLTLLKYSRKKVGRLSRLFLLRRIILTLKPDVVISFLPNAIVYTSLSLLGTGIPFIVSERNDPNSNPQNKIYRRIKEFGFKLADGAVFQTSDAMNYYPKAVQKKGTIIYNPISLKYIPKKEGVKRNNTVLAVGRLIDQKNYPMLLKAFAKFNAVHNNQYKLRIYGVGPLLANLVATMEQLKINSYVEFVGNDNMWHEKEYNDAMYILSSNFEGMSNSLAEAMALGIPSISTDCPIGGSKELIKDGINGYLVPVNDVDAMVEKMNEIVSIPSKLNMNDYLKSDLSSGAIAGKWLAFIKNMEKVIYE